MRYLVALLVCVLAWRPPLPPPNAHEWIDRGLDAEFAGDLATAEQGFLQAAALDRRYLPAWTLAAFYARQRNTKRAIHWAAIAAPMQYDDPRPLRQLLTSLKEPLP